jgi:hypothetical protein
VRLSGKHDAPPGTGGALRCDLVSPQVGSAGSLRAVSAASNRAKGDRDPAEWLPPLTGFRCAYATGWVVVKVRWSLSVDTAERAALRSILVACPARMISVAVLP